jgi:hypothetical protein
MHNGAILDAGSFANNNGAVIAAKDCTGPNGTLRSNRDRSDDHRIRVNIGRWVD